jgi:alanyl-tRNA synthetase
LLEPDQLRYHGSEDGETIRVPKMTQRIYYTDPYVKTFSARVVGAVELDGRTGVVLDQTCFYPESGGQRPDTGEIDGLAVIDVVDQGEEIVHVVEAGAQDLPEPGTRVDGRIDWSRRFDHMQQHTGQHILSQAFVQAVGASTESFHMSEESSTIDLDIEAPSREEIEAAESLANRIVFEDRPIRVDFVSAEAQSELALRKPSERTGTLRLISIERFDRSACGGTHCARTGEVGLIKVRRWERVRQKARIDFVCGYRALRDYQNKTDVLDRLGQQLSVSEREFPAALERQQATVRELRRRLGRLQDGMLELEAAKAVRTTTRIRDREIVRGVWDDLDMKQLNRLASLILAGASNRVVLLASRGEQQGLVLLARSGDIDELDMGELMKSVASTADGRGGGSRDRAQAGGCRTDKLESALERAFELVTANVRLETGGTSC